MTKLLHALESLLYARHVHGVFDDFQHWTDGDKFNLATTVDGTATLTDDAGGYIDLLTAATPADNEASILSSVAENWLFAASKPLIFEARIQYAEADTNKANIFVGLSNDVAENTFMGDDGAGPPSNYSGINFHKVDGGTKWICESSNGTSQETTTTTVTAGGASFVRLRIEVQPLTSTAASVRFYIDDVLVAEHSLTMTSATEMHLLAGVKEGGASAETITIDYIGAWQAR